MIFSYSVYCWLCLLITLFIHANSSQQFPGCFFCIAEKDVNFLSDHAALLSILRNEGVSATGLGSATPQSKPYNYLVSYFNYTLIGFLHI